MPANKIKIDNAFLKRYKSHAAKRLKKKIACKILIVCEGTQTEPNYFKAFKKFNHGTIVYNIDIEGTGMNTIRVVDMAIDLRNKAIGKGQEYDRVWAVFDKDSFSDKDFNGAIKKAKDNHIDTAWSNEAFELWYLYHFQNIETGMSRTQYGDKISLAVNKSKLYKLKTQYKYKKNCEENYNIMNKYGSQEKAINWAKAKSKEYFDERFAKHNPCTMVFKLVLQLIGEDKELNNELDLNYKFIKPV